MHEIILGIISNNFETIDFFEQALNDGKYKIEKYDSAWSVLLKPPDILLIDGTNEDLANEWVKFFRSKQIFDNTPILFITYENNQDKLSQIFQAGANDIIILPSSGLEINLKISTYNELRQSKLQTKKLYEELKESLNFASQTQRFSLPPSLYFGKKYWFASIYQPFQFLGGDVYDVVQFENGDVCTYVADVSGHGVAPALLTFAIKTHIRTILETERQPDLVINKLQKSLSSILKDYYITIFFAFLKDNVCEYINCGQPNIIVYDGKNFAELDTKNSFPIGLFEYTYTSESIGQFTLEDTKVYLLYTDGVYSCYERVREKNKTALQIFLEYLNSDISGYIPETFPFKIAYDIKKISNSTTDDFSILTFGKLTTSNLYGKLNEEDFKKLIKWLRDS